MIIESFNQIYIQPEFITPNNVVISLIRDINILNPGPFAIRDFYKSIMRAFDRVCY